MMQSQTTPYHIPVMLAEVLRFLHPRAGETMLDLTLGGGGHAEKIAEALAPGGTLIGTDRDRDALNAAEAHLAKLRSSLSIILHHSDFRNIQFALDSDPATRGVRLDGALFDLGVSSHQLDAERGFSFRSDQPLDQRMDAGAGPTATDFLSSASEAEIERVIKDYGEERWAGRIARSIVALRSRGGSVRTTGQLAELVERSVPRGAWPKDTHVATRTFQAIRIAVNDELGQLEAGLEAVVERLKPGGRIVVISYHSLEDRIVKRAFAAWSGRVASAPGSSPAAFLPPPSEAERRLEVLTRKPVPPTAEEISRNPRARSAKLRAAVRT